MEDKSTSTKGRDPDAEIALSMAEVAAIEKAEKEEARAHASKEKLAKQGKHSF